MSKYVNRKNAVRPPHTSHQNGYQKVINEIQADGICPFCLENLKKYHKNPILQQTEHWIVTYNMYPYVGAKKHFLIIHKQHISNINELPPEAWADLHELVGAIVKKNKIKGAAFLLRFGDTDYTGASVSHLHAQLVMGSGDPNALPILARVGNQSK